MPLGRFCWYDLMSVEPERSLAFLRDLFGVEGKVSPEYTELSIAGQSFGGLMRKPDAQPPSAWIGYLHVENLAAATRKAEELGATVPMKNVEIPRVGRFSFLKDPQGAYFYLFQAGVPLEDTKPAPGIPCWAELHTGNSMGSAAFYGQLVGYQARFEPGYAFLELDGSPVAGMVEGRESTGWMFYFLVADVQESARRAVELGADQRQPPTEVPGWGKMAVLSEPTGAIFALWQPATA